MVRRALVVGLLIALNAPFAAGQTADDMASLRKDIEALKQGQAALLRELQQIKTLLSAGPPAQRAAGPPSEVSLTVGDGPSKGKKDAKITLVEFTDYQ
jgi:protein-disulfide isomerase